MPKNKVFDALDKTFNTVTTELAEKKGGSITVPEKEDEKLDKDFEEARNLLKRSAEYAEEAAQGILNVATNSDNPRAYEVAANSAKSMAETAEKLMDLHAKTKALDEVQQAQVNEVKTQNNIFMSGSTADLLKALKEAQ